MAGRQKVTASAVLGVSGKPVKVYGYSMFSNTTGPGVVKLYNGTDTTGAEEHRQSGTPDGTATQSFGGTGKLFPGGCFVSIDSDVQYIDIDFEHSQTT